MVAIEYAVRTNGAMPAKEFFEGLGESDQRKLMALFDWMKEHGKIVNREKFNHIEGRLWEFKSFQIRIGCFQEGQTWYLTHGFIKKRNKWPRAEVERGLGIMAEHLSRTRPQ